MSDWEAHWDEASQAYYYSNNITGETTWDQPADYVPPDAAHVADHDAAGSAGAAAADSGLGAVEWRMHPEHDTACCFTDFVDEYGESDGQAYWEDAIPMRADANGTVMTQDEFLADYGDDGGLEAWEAAPMAFDPNSVHNFDDATGTDLSAEPAKVKVRFWRDKRAQLLSGSVCTPAVRIESLSLHMFFCHRPIDFPCLRSTVCVSRLLVPTADSLGFRGHPWRRRECRGRRLLH